MTHDLRQYDLARIASHAWPRCAYRLARIWSADANAPAVFQVYNGKREPLGKLVVTRESAHYGGFVSADLNAALEAVRIAIRDAAEREATRCP